jgi:hypothetical protein
MLPFLAKLAKNYMTEEEKIRKECPLVTDYEKCKEYIDKKRRERVHSQHHFGESMVVLRIEKSPVHMSVKKTN